MRSNQHGYVLNLRHLGGYLNLRGDFEMVIQEIEIKQIVDKEKIQQRANRNHEYINDLVNEISNGVKFPPLDVFDIGGKLLLADGFHRLEAYRG